MIDWFCFLFFQGIPKVELLELVLGHVKGQGKWPRIAMEYEDQLQEVRKILAARKMEV